MQIEVSAFGNLSTDTGSTLAEELTTVPYGANLLLFFAPTSIKPQALKLNNYGLIWLSLRFECARKRDYICLLDGNGKTLKEVIGLAWITRDSCCASANFLDQLNGLSIPRTRSLNDIIIIIIIIDNFLWCCGHVTAITRVYLV